MNPYTLFHGDADACLREYFPDYTYKGTFFDVGAFEPIQISNSHHFYMNGWTCYCFEANPENVVKLEEHRPKEHIFPYAISDTDSDSIKFHKVYSGSTNWTASFSAIEISSEYKATFGWNDNWYVEEIIVPQKKLDSIIKENIPSLERIDILTIDVEGGELNCLKGFDIFKT